MPWLDTQQMLRGLRALMLLGLAWEVLNTVKYPWHSEQQEDAYYTPAWRLNAVLGNASNKSDSKCAYLYSHNLSAYLYLLDRNDDPNFKPARDLASASASGLGKQLLLASCSQLPLT